MNLPVFLCLALQLSAQEPAFDERGSYLAHIAAAEASLRLGEGSSVRRWLDAAPRAPRGWEWHWLDAASDESVADWTLEDGAVSVAIAPSGERVAVVMADGSIRLVDRASGAELRVLRGHEEFVHHVSFAPDGSRLVSSSQDRTVRVWEVQSGACVHTFRAHKYPVAAAVFSPDGSLVASCSYERPAGSVEGTVHVWDAATGEIVETLKGGAKPLSSIAFTSDGNRIACGSWDFCVFVWELGGGSGPRKLSLPDEGLYNAVDAVAFDPRGELVACGSKDKTVRVWSLASGDLVGTLRDHAGYGGSITIADTARERSRQPLERAAWLARIDEQRSAGRTPMEIAGSLRGDTSLAPVEKCGLLDALLIRAASDRAH